VICSLHHPPAAACLPLQVHVGVNLAGFTLLGWRLEATLGRLPLLGLVATAILLVAAMIVAGTLLAHAAQPLLPLCLAPCVQQLWHGGAVGMSGVTCALFAMLVFRRKEASCTWLSMLSWWVRGLRAGAVQLRPPGDPLAEQHTRACNTHASPPPGPQPQARTSLRLGGPMS
jgi:hypothetical protein